MNIAANDNPLRDLPAVHILLSHPDLAELMTSRGRAAVLGAAREVLSNVRAALAADPTRSPAGELESLVFQVRSRLDRERPTLRRVLNATGILLHAGLGRAPLAAEALEAVVSTARGYSNLEF